MRRDRCRSRDGGRARARVRRLLAGGAARALRRRRPGGRLRRHLELVAPIVRAALDSSGASLDEVDRVAVTQGPGLVGALLVGVSAAKAIAWARRLPLVPVDHLDGHLASLYLEPDPLGPPFTCLLASGGHTMLLAVQERGRSERARHDARRRSGRGVRQRRAAARPWLSGGSGHRRARPRRGRGRLRVPRRDRPGLDFSFSGLKTALLYAVRDLGPAEAERRKADLAASYQRAIVNALVRRLRAAAEQTGLARIAVVGGVAANSELRAALPDAAFAPLALCTDNAAMIASAARFVEPLPYPRYLDLDAYASRHVGRFRCSWGRRPRCSSSARPEGTRRRRPRRRSTRRVGRACSECALRCPPRSATSCCSSRPRSRSRSAAAGGRASEQQTRAWSTAEVAEQEQFLATAGRRRRADRAGVPLHARRQRVLRPPRSDLAGAPRRRP